LYAVAKSSNLSPVTFLTHLAIAVSRCHKTKSAPPLLGAVGVRRPHASGSLLPPPSLLSLRLAPSHSARKNTSLRSAVFSLLRSSSGLHNLFLPAFKTHKEKQQQINSLLSEKIAKLAITI
jgi:hypothetical protein